MSSFRGPLYSTNEIPVFFPPQNEEGKELEPFLSSLPVLQTSLLEGEDRIAIKVFLELMGVKPLKPEAVIRNWLLPRYRQTDNCSVEENRAHVRYVFKVWDKVAAFEKWELPKEIGHTPLLWAYKGVRHEESRFIEPQRVYLPQAFTGNSDLEIYFASSRDVWFVDPYYLEPNDKLEGWCSFLKELRAADLPRRIPDPTDRLSWTDKTRLREEEGCKNWTSEKVTDCFLDGLDTALKHIREQNDEAIRVAISTLRLLSRIPKQKRDAFFMGEYRWEWYKKSHSMPFAAAFYKYKLRDIAWIPDEQGNLHRPEKLFVPNTENKRHLGSSVFYLHPDFDLTDKPENEPARWLARQLGVNLNADKGSVLGYLRSLSGTDVALDAVEPLYRFLQQRGIRKDEFSGQSLIFTPSPSCWWQVDQAFWEDESPVFGNTRGYLKAYYPEELESFFVGVGVSVGAAFSDYAHAVRETALQEQITSETRERLHALYRHIGFELQEKTELQKCEEWQQILNGRCWLGVKGKHWGFFGRDQLVWNDHDYLAQLFKEKLPFWTFSELQDLARYLQIDGCSRAQFAFDPTGEQDMLDEWSIKVRNLVNDINCFLKSPRWKNQYGETIFLSEPDKLTVRRVESPQVTYVLKGICAPASEPRYSYMDITHNTIWLSRSAVEQEYPDLIGDALQECLGVQELREFVKDLLTVERGKVLQRWRQRGLNTSVEPTPPPPVLPVETPPVSPVEPPPILPVEPSPVLPVEPPPVPPVEPPIVVTPPKPPRLPIERDGEEGPEHRELKKKIASNPALLGPGLRFVQEEYQIHPPLKDAADVLLQDQEGEFIPVEIETSISDKEEGLWQAIKYKHLVATQEGIACEKVRSFLVAPSIPEDVKAKCAKYGIEFREISVGAEES